MRFFTSIAFKIVLIEVVVLCLVMLPASYFEQQLFKKQVREDFKLRCEQSLTTLAKSLELPLWDFAEDQIRQLINARNLRSPFKTIQVFDQNEKLLASNSDNSQINAEQMEYKITLNGKFIGRITAYPDNNYIENALAQNWQQIVFKNLFLFLLVLSLTYLFINLAIIKKIYRLAEHSRTLEHGDFSTPFLWEPGDEINLLGKQLEKSRVFLANSFKALNDSNINLEKLVMEKTAQVVHNSRLASLGEMAAGIAHEINNPLTIIEGNAIMLSKFSKNEQMEKKIATILNSTSRITKIVKGLRKFSRSDSSSEMHSVNIKNIIEEARDLCTHRLTGQSVDFKFDQKEDVFVMGNELELEQVFVNLINNAIDAIKSNQEKWIRIIINERADAIVVSVLDSGNGIPNEVADKLFQPFFTTKKVGEGTGLGLSITKGILDTHNAHISVKPNEPNTCFEIVFPAIKGNSHVA